MSMIQLIMEIRKMFGVKIKDCPYNPMTMVQWNAIRELLTKGLWKRVTWRTVYEPEDLEKEAVEKQEDLGVTPSTAAVTEIAKKTSSSFVRNAVNKVKGKGLCDRDEILSLCELNK